MKNFTHRHWVSLLLVIPLLFAPVLTVYGEEADLPQTEKIDEALALEDIDILEAFGSLLTAEQLAALETAFSQMKDSIISAEKAYQDMVKVLKDKYRDAVQYAVKNIDDETELTAVIDRLQYDILADFTEGQKTFDSSASQARALLQEVDEAWLIPAEITDVVMSWHLNKELNTANELPNYIESFKNISGNGNGTQGQGTGGEKAGQSSMNQNTEKNQETVKNQNEQKNQEQIKQQEQNTEGNVSQSQQQGQKQDQQKGQSQSTEKGGKGKGGK